MTGRIFGKKGAEMATLSDLMKESEKLKFRLLQKKMMVALTYLTALYFKLRADRVVRVQKDEFSAR